MGRGRQAPRPGDLKVAGVGVKGGQSLTQLMGGEQISFGTF